MWVRWDEASNTFSLCDKAGKDSGSVAAREPGRPTGDHLVVSFGPEIKSHSYPVELSVADDSGNTDRFFRPSEVTVE
jgi:hypothetical protein